MLAAAAMAMVAEWLRPALEDATAPAAASRLVQLMLLGYAIGVVAIVYALAAYALRLPEPALMLAKLTARLGSRSRRPRVRQP
jgi:hypothetical protein